ncbi:MAG: FAD binding domain-containing protein [Acidimicrobiaceae bacterium]|nr:FAD binding domain-containing protein [Acidimicrobiaceae bacterium]
MSTTGTDSDAQTAAGLISRSHLGIEPFSLYRADSLTDAASMVASGAWAHAGGIDVAQRLRDGEAAPALVPLRKLGRGSPDGLDVLDEISLGDGVLFIGAAVTHARIETDPLVRAHRPDLADAWRTIGNVRIRSTGTMGGNLMAFDAGYDAAPILAAAGASLIFADADGSQRRCAVADRPRDRLLVGCEVPLAGHVVYDRSLKPVVSVAVGDDCVAIGCAYQEVKVLPAGATDPPAVGVALAELPDPIGDAFASAAYRRRMIGVLVNRCLQSHIETVGSDEAEKPGVSARPAAPASARSSAEELRGDTAAPAGRPSKTLPDGLVGDAADDSIDIAIRLNGEPFPISAPPSEMLVDTIRTRAGLGGTRVGCDQAVCGACTVLMDDTPTASCSTFAWQTDGREVLTIEASHMAETGAPTAGPAATLPVVQREFAELSAFQCGYCTPGLILTASALLAQHREPDRTTICDWLDSNVCRCTGYLMVIEAVEAAAAALRSEPAVAPDETP